MLTTLRFVFGIALACVLLGCAGGQTGSEGARGLEPPVIIQPPPCTSDLECSDTLDLLIAPLAQPAQGGARRLVAAECVATEHCGDWPSNTCWCSVARGDERSGNPLFLGGKDCALFGRSLACLWPQAELPACVPGTCDCARACSHAIDLLEADDDRAVQAQARTAKCEQGSCRYVVALDDRCYAGALPSTASAVVDCALPDDALLSAVGLASGARSVSNPNDDTTACRVDGTFDQVADSGIAGCLQDAP